ncbi:MAG: hypothetical protein WEA10_00795 [Actinomycetota bacterium]
MNARKKRLLDKVRALLPSYLEPGEQPQVILQAVTGANPWLITGIVTAVAIAIVVPLGIADILTSIWAYVALGALVGAATGAALVASSSWVVLTDRRVLLLKLSFWDQTPTGLRDARPRANVRTHGTPASGGLGYRTVPLRMGEETKVLRINRLWQAEAQELATALAPQPPP